MKVHTKIFKLQTSFLPDGRTTTHKLCISFRFETQNRQSWDADRKYTFHFFPIAVYDADED